jgi:hypothetical protein
LQASKKPVVKVEPRKSAADVTALGRRNRILLRE